MIKSFKLKRLFYQLTKDPNSLPEPLENCIWCEGYGYEWIDCGDEVLNGYDYRSPCRCRFRNKN